AALALQYELDSSIENLARIETELGAYGPGGFHDAVAVGSGAIASRHLSLDQSMILGALGNVLLDEQLHEWFATDEVAAQLRPVIEQEVFRAHG
ncbi:MAG: cellobiose phosphorylase, partial [Brachybacterium sp.]|nr:cellobiose phosphorylase [Brachybacterium sp.]